MNNNIFVIDNFLSFEICDKIINHCLTDANLNKGKVGSRVDENQKKRYDIFLNNKKQIISELDDILYLKHCTSIQDNMRENIKYREPYKVGYYLGENNYKAFYNYHTDTSGSTAYRNISMIVALSDPNDYDGGELHFKTLDVKYKLKKGTAIFFKSNLLHGVTPVLSGKRFVLISFFFDNFEKKQLTCQTSPESTYLPNIKFTCTGDVDYSDNYPHSWKDNDEFYFENNESKTLLIIFSGFGQKNSKPTFIFYNLLRNLKTCNKLFIRDLSCTWYLKKNNFFRQRIHEYMKSGGYTKNIFMGCSAGGYAAILFGSILNASNILAFSPQTILNKDKEIKLNDFRFSNTCRYVQTLPDISDKLNLQNVMNDSNIQIYFGETADKGLDSKHAHFLQNKNIILHSYQTNQHTIALYLRDKGLLMPIISKVLSSG